VTGALTASVSTITGAAACRRRDVSKMPFGELATWWMMVRAAGEAP